MEVMTMPGRLKIELSQEQREELAWARDHDRLAYVRERCAAILKVADGESGRHVALYGLLKRRDTDSVYGWLRRYQAEGVAGLLVRKGRGRKPAFSPSQR